jgi:hypothetical protein
MRIAMKSAHTCTTSRGLTAVVLAILISASGLPARQWTIKGVEEPVEAEFGAPSDVHDEGRLRRRLESVGRSRTVKPGG